MLTMASAVLTLLDSSTPEASCTAASAGASVPSFMRNRPSSPRSMLRRRIDELDATDGRGGIRRLALRHDRDRSVAREEDRGIRRHVDRAAITEHRATGAGGELAVRIELQIAGARVGLLAVRVLHRDPARAIDRDVEVAAGGEQRAAGVSQPVGRVGGVDARGEAGAIDRAALERREIGAKAGGADVGEVVVVDGLRAQGFLRAGHRHVEHAVHDLATCRRLSAC